MKYLRVLIFFFYMFIAANASAIEQIQELVRQSRTMAMGGAGVGLADDSYSLFHNPAGLAGLEERKFQIGAFGLEASWDAYSSLDELTALASDFSISSLNVLMGKDIYFRASEVPMIMLPHFAIAYIIDTQMALNGYNKVSPTFNLGFMITHGLQIGTAWSFKQGRHPTEEFRVGVAGKLLFRKGGYYDISTSGLLQASGDGSAYLNSLIGNFSTAVGGDIGVQYIKKIDKTANFSIGSSVTDIGVSFEDTRTQPQRTMLNAGIGYQKFYDATKLSFALDVRDMFLATSFTNKLNMGGEISFGFIDFQLGLNQLNATYGAGIDFWLCKLRVLSYAEELGIVYHQNFSRRNMIQLDFSMPI